MHEAMWAGIDLKVEYASFHLQQMIKAVYPPRWTTYEAAAQAADATQVAALGAAIRSEHSRVVAFLKKHLK